MYKKSSLLILSAIFISAFFFGGFFVGNTHAEIIPPKVNNGAASLSALYTGNSTSTNICIILNGNLGQGRANDRALVSIIQRFLISHGYLTIPADTTLGYFGQLTERGVRLFQSSFGIDPTGFVGPITRARITLLTCGSTFPGATSTPAVSSLSPNAGPVGTQVNIYGSGFAASGNNVNFSGVSNFHLNNLNSSDGKTLVFNVPVGDDYECLNTRPACSIAQRSTALGLHQVSVTTAKGTSNSINFNVTASSTNNDCSKRPQPSGCVTGAPSLISILPTSGPVGTRIAIKGSGFTQDNRVHFASGGAVHVTSSENGTLLYFTVPDSTGPCDWAGDTSDAHCQVASMQIVPGQYQMSVENTNGQSGNVTFVVTSSSGSGSGNSSGLNFTVHAVVLDGNSIDFVQPAMVETAGFISSHSQLRLTSSIAASAESHTYTNYSCGTNSTCVLLNIANLSQNLLNNLPPADMYVFFYKTNGQPPLQAGSTYGFDLNVGGTLHTYATIPTDVWWFNDTMTAEGYTPKATIITHEINNQINQIVHQPPIVCPLMTATDGLPFSQYEGDRLAKLDAPCYQRIQANRGGSGSANNSLPSISSINPTSGRVGTIVTVNGTGFTATNNVVRLNGFVAARPSSNGSSLSFGIPEGLSNCNFAGTGCGNSIIMTQATTYKLTVETANGVSNPVNLTVTSEASPGLPPPSSTDNNIGKALALSTLSPSSGAVGTRVTISGRGFSASGNNVNFSGVSNYNLNNLSSSNGTTLSFTVPSSDDYACLHSSPSCSIAQHMTATGAHNVSVTNSRGTSNSISFTVTQSGNSNFSSADSQSASILDALDGLIGQAIVNQTAAINNAINTLLRNLQALWR